MRQLRSMVLLAAVAAATPLAAQTSTARVLTAEGAQRALAAAAAEATRQRWAVSIAVVDAAGELLAFTRLDGAAVSTVENARGKARTAARWRRPTRMLDSAIGGGRVQILGFDGITPIEGGVPIVVEGAVVGAVGVSGVTSAQDAVVAQAGAAAVTP